ncbi:D-xylose 1-dehydrogenase Gfo6 [Natronorarus salvus]|uniref:D-xylose 1-dehydrogenase Gfo6 n=1 Tax=Natronorarus salvus TaxID=3117733 RepID=UPI002F265AD3
MLDDPTTITHRAWESHGRGTLRFAVVGLGWWTREYAFPALDAAENCTPTVAVSGSAEKREDAIEDHESVSHALDYDAFEAGEAREAYDAVYVCTPNALHLPSVEAGARYGKDVLCEKPMEASIERAEKMVAACDDADVTLMVAYRLQTDPVVRRVRELVREGAIGDPVHLYGHMSQPALEFFDGGGWRLDPDLAGPGASVTDLGVYPTNTARFVLDADPVAVSAHDWSGHEAFSEVPDERSSFLLTFPDGITALCSVSQNAALSGSFRVIGTEGTIELSPAFFSEDRGRLTVSRGEHEVSVEYEPVDQMREEVAYFADRVLAGEPVGPDGEHGLRDVEVVEAVYEAAASGRRVDL